MRIRGSLRLCTFVQKHITHNYRSIAGAQCEPAWKKDPVFGVIGIQSGPQG